MAGGTREVDVSLRSKVGSAEVLVIVECRDRGRRADIQWIDQVKTKRDAVGAAKAIAVASGDFSKKALTAARAYGIDTRTLAQVNSAEIKRWAGTLTMSLHETFFDKLTVTVKLVGTDPLPQEIATRFNELIKAHAFDAKFIAYPEGLLSPLDVVRKIHPIPEMPKGTRIKFTVPPNSSFILAENPTLMFLVGTPPEDGSSAEIGRALEFEEGEALFCLDGFTRPLAAVHLNFTVRVDSGTPIDPQSYRYESSTGLIEIAEHIANVRGERLVFTQYRHGGN